MEPAEVQRIECYHAAGGYWIVRYSRNPRLDSEGYPMYYGEDCVWIVPGTLDPNRD